MKRYGSINSIMKMPFYDGMNIILTAIKGDLKDKYFQMYVIERLFMTEPMGFDQYFHQNTECIEENPVIVKEKVDNILKKVLKRGGDNNGGI